MFIMFIFIYYDYIILAKIPINLHLPLLPGTGYIQATGVLCFEECSPQDPWDWYIYLHLP